MLPSVDWVALQRLIASYCWFWSALGWLYMLINEGGTALIYKMWNVRHRDPLSKRDTENFLPMTSEFIQGKTRSLESFSMILSGVWCFFVWPCDLPFFFFSWHGLSAPDPSWSACVTANDLEPGCLNWNPSSFINWLWILGQILQALWALNFLGHHIASW